MEAFGNIDTVFLKANIAFLGEFKLLLHMSG